MPLDEGLLGVSYRLFEGGLIKLNTSRVQVDFVDGFKGLVEVVEVGELQMVDSSSSIVSDAGG